MNAMPVYRTYIIGRADHFWGAEDIDCADDQEAIQKVQQTMDGRDVEVWERGRFIVRLSSDLIRSRPPHVGAIVAEIAGRSLRAGAVIAC